MKQHYNLKTNVRLQEQEETAIIQQEKKRN